MYNIAILKLILGELKNEARLWEIWQSWATAYNLYQRSDGGQKKPAIKPRGGKRGQEIWVGTKAQAPKSFLRDFYMANEKRPPETKVGFEG